MRSRYLEEAILLQEASLERHRAYMIATQISDYAQRQTNGNPYAYVHIP